MNGDRRQNAAIMRYVRDLLKRERDMAKRHKKDPVGYDEEAEMAKLHARDLRNATTPTHEPIVQHVDIAAAVDEGLIDAEDLQERTEDDGDAAFAADALQYSKDQEDKRIELEDATAASSERVEEIREEQGQMHGDAVDEPIPGTPEVDITADKHPWDDDPLEYEKF